jgi:glycosyltransferase involved in cell wall biosynthesis
MPKPLVSLCVPTRNRCGALRESLPKILAQSYSPLEILISDNGSTDGTETLCREAAQGDPRVRYVRHSENIGLYGNHNFCIDQARGEFLGFFHDHDEHDSTLVEQCVRFLQDYPEAGMVCSDWELIDEEGRGLGIRSYPVAPLQPGLTYIEQTFRSGRSSVATPGALIRRSALGRTRFNEQGAIGFGDFPVWFRMAEEHAVGHLSKTLWKWRQHRESQSARTIESMAQDYRENLSRYCDEHLVRWPRHGSRVARWRRAIRRYLFWALAFEVGLYFREPAAPLRPEGHPTLFEILDYRLSPEAFRHALDQMKACRTGPLENTTFFVMQALVRRKITQPLTWATRNAALFRRLLRLC